MDDIHEDTYHPAKGSNATSKTQSNTTHSVLSLPTTTNPPGPNNPPKPKVWLLFGATGQIGRSVVKTALKHGDMVCAVGRNSETSPRTMEQWFSNNPHYLGLVCDIRIPETVQLAFSKALKQFGRVDVVANCAGYGVIGSCEDQDDYEIRNQFETNFMGTLNVIHATLKYFRERQSGRYLILSSTSGALGVPGMGPYCASKYAVEGLVESMLYEVDPFNVKLTLIEPGHLRRDDVHVAVNGDKVPLWGHFGVVKPSEPYQGKDSPAAHAHRILQWIGGSAATSTVKAAELIWQLAHCSYPPLRLLLGTFAVESIRDRLKSIIEEIEDWKHLNFPPLDDEEQDLDDGDQDKDQDQGGDQDLDGENDNDNEDDNDNENDDEDEDGVDGDGLDENDLTESGILDHREKDGHVKIKSDPLDIDMGDI